MLYVRFIHLVNLFGWLNILFFSGILYDAGLVIVIIMTSLRSAVVFPTFCEQQPGFWNQGFTRRFLFFFSLSFDSHNPKLPHTHQTKIENQKHRFYIWKEKFLHTHTSHMVIIFSDCIFSVVFQESKHTHTQTQLLQYSQTE